MQYSIEINKNTEIFDIDKVAKQAAGAVLMRQGKSVVLATVAREEKQVEEDFLPLTVQYIEKAYAAGKIPGGYVKRETKPSDAETLTARIIDRSLRPLFPKGYAYPTQIVVMVLSADPKVDLQVMSLNAASVALYLSDIPMKAPVCGVRIGKIDGNFILNPNNEELQNSTLDLYVAGVKDELLMIEMRALPDQKENEIFIESPYADVLTQTTSQNMNELSEDEILEALNLAQKAILNGSNAYEEAFSKHKKNSQIELKNEIEYPEILAFIENNFQKQIKEAINQMAKSERASKLNKIAKEISNLEIAKDWSEESVLNTLAKVKRKLIREQILNEGKRADGRSLNEVRPISIETNILPNAHGSCLFTRGQTQALVVATLGGENDAQMIDLLTEKNPISERFMVNYNFPGFSVGEASPIKAPGRRELGHGNLAKRALYPSVDENYPYVIRLVSEILESNGSSSMATVCGGSLALKAAGVPSLKLVAG
ncbi:polyribonucleotide nucleotidyltransferase, partial [Campylobacter jejuni]|nr:polyribonucleotide nucleotidyltransferase [Campylobacter jejuni]